MFLPCFEYLIFYLFVIFIVISSQNIEYKIEDNDRILFLGNTNLLLGSTNPNGFINLFQDEIKLIYHNITVFNHGSREYDYMDLYMNIRTYLDYYQPTKVILSFGYEIFYDTDHKMKDLRIIRYEIESIIAKIMEEDEIIHNHKSMIDLILIPIIIYGEKIDGSNQLDTLIEDYLFINQQIARDYYIMYIELFYEFSKYIENNNIENLPHSILTLNGNILNEYGHLYVCLLLLKAFHIDNHNLIEDNDIIKEEKRIKDIKEEIFHIESYYNMQNNK